MNVYTCTIYILFHNYNWIRRRYKTCRLNTTNVNGLVNLPGTGLSIESPVH